MRSESSEPSEAAEPRRRQLHDPAGIEVALATGEPLRLVLVRKGPLSAGARSALERCRGAGVPVRSAAAREIERMDAAERTPGQPGPEPSEILALVGQDPDARLDEIQAAGGALWLLAGVAYPGNAGFAIRSAEVSGAAGVLVDATFGRPGRRQALRTAMRADRFFPVRWTRTAEAVAGARAAGRRVLAIEDSGRRAPWEVDLTGPVLLVIGGEAGGIPHDLLADCDEVLRIPMRGFVPSYNLQAAMAMVAGERLRQLQEGVRPADV